MYQVERSALVMHPAAHLSELVNDVDRYQEFLPWCGGARVLSRDDRGYTASVDIAFKGLKRSFTTRNTMVDDQRMEMVLVDGPFSDLSGTWTFKAISPEASRISLSLSFGFSNRVVEAAVGPVFRLIADSMVESFCRRADELAERRG
ncbi:MAG: type II toxin-antitoxin system RatA family toxin [Gammaproteobacteria bacterium]|nr:type II toxin-antitoxin system RatA family toxin [Gammaproteobacteria bacterium]MXY65227.1 type II toxin-antitoxin system RatA family toxin [Gammaproteobacteria bacterium]MYG67854.1 type II toxin-antitoxin system RatA family toxin [Gammaproteobacteria bacterium]